MGFAINPSLNYLNINTEYISEFYRSTAAVVLPDARFRGQPSEAYICLTKVNNEMRAYVALLNTGLQSILVYTSDYVASNTSDYPKALKEAETFTTNMGFRMEKVNLDFSPAMREVILKGFRIMRPPSPQKKKPQHQPKVEVPEELGNALDVSTMLPEAEVAEATSDIATELQTLRAELASSRAAMTQVTREKVSLEQRFAQERAALKAACEQAEEKITRLLHDQAEKAQSRQGEVDAAALQEQERKEFFKQRQQDREELEQLKKQLVTLRDNASAKVKQQQQELTAITARLEQLQNEKSGIEQQLEIEIERLKEQLTSSLAAREETEKQLAAEKGASKAIAARVEELDQVKLSLNRERQQNAEMASSLAAVREELAAAGMELQQRDKEAALAAEQLQQLTSVMEELSAARAELAELVKLGERFRELQKQLAVRESELTASREELQKLAQAGDKNADQMQQLVAVKDELAAAKEELSLLRKGGQNEDDLRQQLAAVREELAAAKGELAVLIRTPAAGAESAADIGQALKEKEAVEAEYVRLATSSLQKETELADSLAAAEAENERLARELEIQTQVAAMEQAALRAELRRLIVGGQVAPAPIQLPTETPYPAGAVPVMLSPEGGQPAAQQPVQPVQVVYATAAMPSGQQRADLGTTEDREVLSLTELEPEEEPDDTPDGPIAVDGLVLKEFTNEFGGFCFSGTTSTTEFSIDKSLGVIEYSDPSEIVVVFYSSNTVQAVPDSSSIQRCRGYVVALKQEGKYRVYVAWHLTETGKVVVCLPDPVPTDSDSCIQTLQDAISYFEIVGFMMDISDLGDTVKSYNRALKKIPVLRRVSRN